VSGRRGFLRDVGAGLAAAFARVRPARGAGVAGDAPEASGLRPSSSSTGTAAATEPPLVRVVAEGFPEVEVGDPVRLDLAPARWLWLPSQRTLANTFVLFRHEVELSAPAVKARGWVTADSRYRLSVNGRRAQFGPAPCDPRSYDVDPVDLTAFLRPGLNVIGAEVLFYGVGEGTWPSGKPGFLFALRIEEEGGRVETVLSDESWRVLLDRAHRPGQFKRWYLRTLQEDLDARLRPRGWDEPGFSPGEDWVAPLLVDGRADRPAAASRYYEYLSDAEASVTSSELRAREIPRLREAEVPPARLAASGRVFWRRDPRDWFEYRVPGSFEIDTAAVAEAVGEQAWTLSPKPGERQGAFAIFEWPQQIVGFPRFAIDAPAGAVVDVMTQESHDPANAPWLDTHHFSWSRFTCAEGENRFEAFDFESLRFLQLHVRNASRPVRIRDVGVRRRMFDWPAEPHFRCSDEALQRVFEAAHNTLLNCAQETCVDGMGRERQQYSGDCAHQLHAIRYVYGERRMPRRFFRTYAMGESLDGYWLDAWPAYDRLNRVAQRQVGATVWGPMLDHIVEFILDNWLHHQETGEVETVRPVYPRLCRFADYLMTLRRDDGLLPAEDMGTPSIWIDQDVCYPTQRQRQLPFNLFTAGVFTHALAPLARLFGEPQRAQRHAAEAEALLAATVRRFWDPGRGLFVNNRPWQREDGGPRLCDRSLGMALLFEQYPGGRVQEAIDTLVARPPELGLSYPSNACWRYWALARHGRIDAVLRDLRERWATMASVRLNNTIGEEWTTRPDSTSQWSHTAIVPLYSLYMDVAGIRPAAPGFARVAVRPQLGDLRSLEVTARTVRGPVTVAAEASGAGHRVEVTLPPDTPGELALPAGAAAPFPVLPPDKKLGLSRYQLPPGATSRFDLPRPAGR
jgi:alpha-L-rhamnosidase